MAKPLQGTTTHENLKAAFAGESQANRRYLYFARRADIEGYPDIGGLFRDTSEAETGHAFGHLDFLKEVGDPCTGVPIGDTAKNLKSAVEKLRIDVDPEITEQVRAQFSVSNEKRTRVPDQIMEGLKLARSHALGLLSDLERKLKDNPGAFDLPRSLSALRDRVAKMVGTP